MKIHFHILFFLMSMMISMHAFSQCSDCYFTLEEIQGCDAGEIKLQASTNGEFISWSTADAQDLTIASPTNAVTIVKPTKPQTYVATVNLPFTNYITNGNFDAGVVGFTTNYNHKNPDGGYYVGTDILFKVEADDTDGNIVSVSYYEGNNLLGTTTTAPFDFTWISPAQGSYFVRAIATDNDGLTSTTHAVPVQVGNAPSNASPASLTKRGSGSSSQSITLGDPIDGFYYDWTNATTVVVYGLPAGITASIDGGNQEVTFSGTPTEIGTFPFTVITEGGMPETYRTGEITVTGTGNSAPSIDILQPYDGAEFNAGDFAVGTTPSDYASNFVNKNDHTGNDGYMLIVDGSNQTDAIVYTATVNLQIGKDYEFSVWVSNIHNEFIDATSSTLNSPEIIIDINGVSMNMGEIPQDTAWHKLTIPWTALSTSTTITILNNNTAVDENDFALDDIGMYEIEAISETITVTPCNNNVFSPDGDGQLDDFFIEGDGTANIYNPGGTLIKTLTLPAYWDGRDQDGVLVNAGLYAVIINESTYLQVTVVR